MQADGWSVVSVTVIATCDPGAWEAYPQGDLTFNTVGLTYPVFEGAGG